ncbi:MAG TPA: radical SAM protein [Terriglobia bacterium]|nr:radical SAM protein [Terriglobia bacterium]
MARLVIELTNRCNLRCQHCFEERHAATGDLSLEIIEKVLQEGKDCGIDHLAFTGGEPIIHYQFPEVIRRVGDAGYTFSLVSNGTNFPRVYAFLILHRQWFTGVTFSLDGAREETHDRLRGKGSYRKVMQAASICVFKDLPFTFNMVLTAQNRHEVEEMVSLAERLGSKGVRFGHLMPTPETATRGLDLSPQERREVEAEIWRLQKSAAVPVGMAPGYFSESPFFPCAPLELKEFNLDYRGNLTLCCHLSGYSGSNQGTDVMANLYEVSLAEACERFRRRVATYLADKRERVSRGEFGDLDHFPCWYCVKYLGKVPGLKNVSQKSWAQA